MCLIAAAKRCQAKNGPVTAAAGIVFPPDNRGQFIERVLRHPVRFTALAIRAISTSS
jgi:hypothetical protein